ncbi:hypothetical protein C7476_13426 [Phyllobacterium bourgognense]|uniref:Uncharacterized protein n=1 Tax=Phyllobacterium bourgognense TaxID=314236 RepID=A0A368YCB8_9HYPH|nr:hypothetical protein C7476_13426 [Phyllobacterium bourgognense]
MTTTARRERATSKDRPHVRFWDATIDGSMTILKAQSGQSRHDRQTVARATCGHSCPLRATTEHGRMPPQAYATERAGGYLKLRSLGADRRRGRARNSAANKNRPKWFCEGSVLTYDDLAQTGGKGLMSSNDLPQSPTHFDASERELWDNIVAHLPAGTLRRRNHAIARQRVERTPSHRSGDEDRRRWQPCHPQGTPGGIDERINNARPRL